MIKWADVYGGIRQVEVLPDGSILFGGNGYSNWPKDQLWDTVEEALTAIKEHLETKRKSYQGIITLLEEQLEAKRKNYREIIALLEEQVKVQRLNMEELEYYLRHLDDKVVRV